jgi:hypothetical protein
VHAHLLEWEVHMLIPMRAILFKIFLISRPSGPLALKCTLDGAADPLEGEGLQHGLPGA